MKCFIDTMFLPTPLSPRSSLSIHRCRHQSLKVPLVYPELYGFFPSLFWRNYLIRLHPSFACGVSLNCFNIEAFNRHRYFVQHCSFFCGVLTSTRKQNAKHSLASGKMVLLIQFLSLFTQCMEGGVDIFYRLKHVR